VSLVGRTSELKALRDAWTETKRGTSRLVVLWGRRRVGKTFLLSQFTKNLPCVYFTATRNDAEPEQLRRLHEAAGRGLGDRIHLAGGSFGSIEAALRFFQELSIDSPLVVVLDEAPRLASARQDLGDIISAVLESPPAGSRLLLIICGSAVASMRRLIGPDGGLYRRANPELRLDPLDPWESAQLLGPTVSAEDVVAAYSACGGYPLHLAEWDGSRPPDDNLARLAGTPAGLLVRDAVDIMFEDLDARSGYERVLATMAHGPVRRSKIAGRAQQRIDYTLGHLQRSGYVIAERPLGASPTADPLYRLVDTYLRFWFSVLREDAELIDGGQGQAVLRRVRPRWRAHVEAVWEGIARAHAIRLVSQQTLPDLLIGRWWRDEVEIDVLGLDSDGATGLVGDAKWQDRRFDLRQLDALRRRAALIDEAVASPTLAIWSRTGVVSEISQKQGVLSFTPQTVFDRG
jgi:uncharacterized protein